MTYHFLSLHGVFNLFIVMSTSSLNPRPSHAPPFSCSSYVSLFFAVVCASLQTQSSFLLSYYSGLDFKSRAFNCSSVKSQTKSASGPMMCHTVRSPVKKVRLDLALSCRSSVFLPFWTCYKWFSVRDLVKQSHS